MKSKRIHLKKLEKDYAGQFLPDLLMEEVLEDLEMEQAGEWLLNHLASDRTQFSGNHVYSTSLFSITVDYTKGTVAVAAELACHPQDEILDLQEFASVLAKYFSERSKDGGEYFLARGDQNFGRRHDILTS